MDAIKLIREVIASELYPFLEIRYTIESRILFKYRVVVFNVVSALSVWDAYPFVCSYPTILPCLLLVGNVESTESLWNFFAIITPENNSEVVVMQFDVLIWVVDVSINCHF